MWNHTLRFSYSSGRQIEDVPVVWRHKSVALPLHTMAAYTLYTQARRQSEQLTSLPMSEPSRSWLLSLNANKEQPLHTTASFLKMLLMYYIAHTFFLNRAILAPYRAITWDSQWAAIIREVGLYTHAVRIVFARLPLYHSARSSQSSNLGRAFPVLFFDLSLRYRLNIGSWSAMCGTFDNPLPALHWKVFAISLAPVACTQRVKQSGRNGGYTILSSCTNIFNAYSHPYFFQSA